MKGFAVETLFRWSEAKNDFHWSIRSLTQLRWTKEALPEEVDTRYTEEQALEAARTFLRRKGKGDPELLASAESPSWQGYVFIFAQ